MIISDEEAETMTTQQLAHKLQVGKTTASHLVREIKSVSDILQIKGLIHRKDYEAWIKKKQDEAAEFKAYEIKRIARY